MRALVLWVVVAACGPRAAAPAPPPPGPPGEPPPEAPPPAVTDRGPSAPRASDHRCPDGATPLVEPSNPGQTMRSCVVPGKEYRNTPYRHGPYELVGADGRVLLRGAWRDNKQHGLWRWWHASGRLRREMTYDGGVPLTDASWDDAGHPVDRRDAGGTTTWYPGGRQRAASRQLPGGVLEVTTWFENGKVAKQERSRDGAPERFIAEWFDNGQRKYQATYSGNGLVDWKGWSSTGRTLDGDRCVEDADCVTGIQNVCYRCTPPYEAMTRWREAQRRMHPPPPARGCDPGPFPCVALPAPPAAACRASRCVVVTSP